MERNRAGKRKIPVLFFVAAFIVSGCFSPYSGDTENAEARKAEILRRWQLVKPQKTAQTQEEFFDVPPVVTGPNYQAGKLKTAYLNEALGILNLCRFIAGLPDDVRLSDEYTENARHGTVVLAALKNGLTHTPAKPADMNQDFFDKGYKGTSNSNLFWNYSSRGPPYYTPALVVYDAFLNDSDSSNRNALGHRRWALNPSMAYTGFGLAFSGKTESYHAMISTDTARKPAPDYDVIRWPNGPAFPLQFMESYLAWSITVNPAKYQTPKIEDLNIAVRELRDGKEWIFRKGGAGHFAVNYAGYGVANCIIFTPGNAAYADGSIYQVEVRGLKTTSGENVILNYQIEFFSLP